MSDILEKEKKEGSLKRKFEKMSPEEKCMKKVTHYEFEVEDTLMCFRENQSHSDTGSLKRKFEKSPEEKCMKKIHSEFEVEDYDSLMCFGKNQPDSDTASDEDYDEDHDYDENDNEDDDWNRERDSLGIRRCAEKLIDYLKAIQGEPLYFYPIETSVIYGMGNILFFIFCVGTDCVKFSDEHKEEIGKLLVAAIEPIKLYIKYAVHFYTGSNPFILQYRSALQYLITYYADFSAKDSLRELLEDKLTESIKMVDENIALFRNFITEEWGEWDFKKNGGESVPETHTWWGTK